jgi:hypothetical protein
MYPQYNNNFFKKEKTLKKLGIEEVYLTITKAINKSSTVNTMFKGEKLKALLSKVRKKAKMLTVTTSFQHKIGIPR